MGKTKSKSSIHVLALLCLCSTILDLTFADVKPELEIHPKFDLQRKPIGNSLILTCRPTVQAMVTDLTWKNPLHNTIERHANGHNAPAMYTEELSGGSLALMITSLSADMAGQYYCSAKYSGSQQLEASVKIETYVAITWTNAPQNQYPIVGTNYTVKCEVKADPNPTVDWLRNGDQIRTNDKYVVQTHGLLIRNVQESDDDIYTCRAAVVDTGELMERPIRVEVYSPPVISRLATSLEAVEGQSFAANCTAEGKPKPEISWIKDATQQNVASADRFQVNPQTGLLTITSVTQDDYGTYTCIAKNGAGVTDQKTKLNVLVRPSIYELYNVTGVSKKEIAITCRAKGRPAPAITFRRWGSDEEYLPLQQQQQTNNGIDNNNNNNSNSNSNSNRNENISLEQHFDDAQGESSGTLRIAHATRSDDGLYQCLARNIGDTAYKTGHITIEFAPDFSHMANLPPVFSWDERKANLSCLALGIPNATIEWRWHDRVLTENSDQNLQIVTKGPRSDLIVHPVDGRYYSVYKCVARNKHGIAEHDMQLKLARIPDVVAAAIPKQLTATSITFEVRGPRVELGLPITAFTVQYKETNNPDWSLAVNRSWSPDSPYIVENLKPQTMYNFRFAAANQVGIGLWGANLQQSTPKRSAPEEPKIVNAPLPYDNKEKIVMTKFSDRFELQWNVPAHNGEPIDSYQVKYCPGIKISGTWHELESDCTSVDIPKATSYEMNSLTGNTYYRIELRAHNIIGYSSPATITMKTSRGVDVIQLADRQVLSSASIVGIAVGGIIILLIIIDVLCCVTLRMGILATMCRRTKRSPSEIDDEAKLGRDEKEPLHTPSGSMKQNSTVEFDGKLVHSRSGEIIGKNSAV